MLNLCVQNEEVDSGHCWAVMTRRPGLKWVTSRLIWEHFLFWLFIYFYRPLSLTPPLTPNHPVVSSRTFVPEEVQFHLFTSHISGAALPVFCVLDWYYNGCSNHACLKPPIFSWHPQKLWVSIPLVKGQIHSPWKGKTGKRTSWMKLTMGRL